MLSILLKKQEFDTRIIEVIARQNPHRLVFLLMYEEKCQLVLYHSKLYRTPWISNHEMQLKAKGFSLDEIWNTLVEQIAKIEAATWKEQQTQNDLKCTRVTGLQEKIDRIEERLKRSTVWSALKEQKYAVVNGKDAFYG